MAMAVTRDCSSGRPDVCVAAPALPAEVHCLVAPAPERRVVAVARTVALQPTPTPRSASRRRGSGRPRADGGISLVSLGVGASGGEAAHVGVGGGGGE